MALDALILDLDGTIVDSRPWYERVFVNRFGGSTTTVRQKLETNCPPVRLADELGIPRPHLERACRLALDDLSPYPDVISTLQTIAARGVSLALVTAVPAKFAAIALERVQMDRAFRVVVAARRNLRRKPAPDGLLEAIDAIGLSENRDGVWYVGDSVTDMMAARAAGIKFGFASWGYGSQDEMAAADKILVTPRDLESL